MRKSKSILIIIFLIAILIIFQIINTDSTYDLNKIFTVKQLQQDFLKTRRIMENNNPTLYYFHAKETMAKYFDDVYASIDSSMVVKDFYILLSQVVAKANCGHTFLDLPNGFWNSANKIYKYFPFKLHFQDGKAYILKNYSGNKKLVPGAEILAINNVPISQIMMNFFEIISSDGLNQTYKYAKMNRISYGLFPGYPDFPEHYEITYHTKQDTAEKRTIIEALTHQQIIDSKKEQLPVDWKYVPFEFNFADSLNTAILTVKNFVGYSTKDFKQFLANGFNIIQQNGIQNLIVDVRNNDGGDPANATAMLSYLTDTPYIYFTPHVLGYWSLKKPIEPHPLNFKGNIYVLMDGGCFSTTGHFLSIIKYHQWATLIGEESGGSYVCNGCVENYTLPNTKIILNCARCVYRANVHGFKREHGIMPDFEIKIKIENLIQNRDTVKDFVLKTIEGKIADRKKMKH